MDEQTKDRDLVSGVALVHGIYYVAVCCTVVLPLSYTHNTNIPSRV
jgi:hypothetical protein